MNPSTGAAGPRPQGCIRGSAGVHHEKGRGPPRAIPRGTAAPPDVLPGGRGGCGSTESRATFRTPNLNPSSQPRTRPFPAQMSIGRPKYPEALKSPISSKSSPRRPAPGGEERGRAGLHLTETRRRAGQTQTLHIPPRPANTAPCSAAGRAKAVEAQTHNPSPDLRGKPHRPGPRRKT